MTLLVIPTRSDPGSTSCNAIPLAIAWEDAAYSSPLPISVAMDVNSSFGNHLLARMEIDVSYTPPSIALNSTPHSPKTSLHTPAITTSYHTSGSSPPRDKSCPRPGYRPCTPGSAGDYKCVKPNPRTAMLRQPGAGNTSAYPHLHTVLHARANMLRPPYIYDAHSPEILKLNANLGTGAPLKKDINYSVSLVPLFL
jgi:hypothetical protein